MPPMVLSDSTSAAPLASSLSSNKKATAATCLSKVPEEANQLQTALSSTSGLDPVFELPALTAWFLVTHDLINWSLVSGTSFYPNWVSLLLQRHENPHFLEHAKSWKGENMNRCYCVLHWDAAGAALCCRRGRERGNEREKERSGSVLLRAAPSTASAAAIAHLAGLLQFIFFGGVHRVREAAATGT
nr:hypothetical protein Itr_chr01CG10280 [Ipomoea trifida]